MLIYNTSANHWDRLDKWPLSCATGCANASKPLYLTAGHALSRDTPAAGAEFTSYVSDPAKPVPYLPRPVTGANWRTWFVTDQRFVDGRPDVITFVTDALKEPVRISGTPVVNLIASTSGLATDTPYRPRKRSFEKPEPFTPGKPELVKSTCHRSTTRSWRVTVSW